MNSEKDELTPSEDDGDETAQRKPAVTIPHGNDRKFQFETDDIITKLSPPFDDDDLVTFRGWLGPLQNGSFKLFTSRALDRWLEIPKDALLYQLPGKKERDRDAFSIVWVKYQARLVECHRAKACQLVDADFEVDGDPTATYPKYGGSGHG
jgi:hypothetical protein